MSDRTAADFTPGQRVRLHPATDLWMKGLRFGAVDRVGRAWVYVRTDRDNRVHKLAPRNVEAD